jgi:hypothetical protein
MKGYRHWIVPREQFRLIAPADWDSLAVYRFGTGVAAHLFCGRLRGPVHARAARLDSRRL